MLFLNVEIPIREKWLFNKAAINQVKKGLEPVQNLARLFGQHSRDFELMKWTHPPNIVRRHVNAPK